MRNLKVVSMVLTLGTALLSGGSLFAGDRDWDRHDIRRDEAAISRLRADIARDRWRLHEDSRAGRRWEAQRDADNLARDERALDARLRDVRRDRHDYFRDSYRGR